MKDDGHLSMLPVTSSTSSSTDMTFLSSKSVGILND